MIVMTVGLLYASLALATDTSKVEVRASITDGSSTVEDSGLITKTFTTGVRQQQPVSLAASSFTALSKPSGAKGILIDWGTVSNVKLKGLSASIGCANILNAKQQFIQPYNSNHAPLPGRSRELRITLRYNLEKNKK